jgi:ribonuclease Z
MLALVHISSRYHVRAALEEAQAEFANTVAPRDFDLVELPLPEKGEPRLIHRGAVRGEPEVLAEGSGGSAADGC